MKVLEKDTILTVEDLAEFFQIGKSTIKRPEKRMKYVERLHYYCDFTEKRMGKGGKICYIINEVFVQEPPEKTRIYEKNLEIYKEKSLKQIEKTPIITKSGIQRRIQNDEDVKKMNHKPKTQTAYISEGVKEMFGTYRKSRGTKGHINKYIWCAMTKDKDNIQSYEPMTEEQKTFFFGLIKNEAEENEKQRSEYYSLYKQRELTKDEYNNLCQEIDEKSYLGRCSNFKDRFGAWPVYVPEYAVTQPRE